MYSMFRVLTVEGWHEVPEAIAASSGAVFAVVARLYFVVAVTIGGLRDLTANAVFVDEMTPTTTETRKKLDALTEEMAALRQEPGNVAKRLKDAAKPERRYGTEDNHGDEHGACRIKPRRRTGRTVDRFVRRLGAAIAPASRALRIACACALPSSFVEMSALLLAAGPASAAGALEAVGAKARGCCSPGLLRTLSGIGSSGLGAARLPSRRPLRANCS